MRSGDRPGLQNRRAAGNPVTGGFDPHSLPPFIFNFSGPIGMIVCARRKLQPLPTKGRATRIHDSQTGTDSPKILY